MAEVPAHGRRAYKCVKYAGYEKTEQYIRRHAVEYSQKGVCKFFYFHGAKLACSDIFYLT